MSNSSQNYDKGHESDEYDDLDDNENYFLSTPKTTAFETNILQEDNIVSTNDEQNIITGTNNDTNSNRGSSSRLWSFILSEKSPSKNKSTTKSKKSSKKQSRLKKINRSKKLKTSTKRTKPDHSHGQNEEKNKKHVYKKDENNNEIIWYKNPKSGGFSDLEWLNNNNKYDKNDVFFQSFEKSEKGKRYNKSELKDDKNKNTDSKPKQDVKSNDKEQNKPQPPSPTKKDDNKDSPKDDQKQNAKKDKNDNPNKQEEDKKNDAAFSSTSGKPEKPKGTNDGQQNTDSKKKKCCKCCKCCQKEHCCNPKCIVCWIVCVVAVCFALAIIFDDCYYLPYSFNKKNVFITIAVLLTYALIALVLFFSIFFILLIKCGAKRKCWKIVAIIMVVLHLLIATSIACFITHVKKKVLPKFIVFLNLSTHEHECIRCCLIYALILLVLGIIPFIVFMLEFRKNKKKVCPTPQNQVASKTTPPPPSRPRVRFEQPPPPTPPSSPKVFFFKL